MTTDTPDHERLTEKVGSYTLSRFVSNDQIIKDASLGAVLLNDAVIEQAGLAAYYGAMYAKALRQHGILKLNADAVEAKVYSELRDRFAEEGKKTTEKALEQAVAADPRVKESMKALIVADEVRQTLFSACDAMRQRRDSLEMLGRFQSEELKGALRIAVTDQTRSKAMDMRSRLASRPA